VIGVIGGSGVRATDEQLLQQFGWEGGVLLVDVLTAHLRVSAGGAAPPADGAEIYRRARFLVDDWTANWSRPEIRRASARAWVNESEAVIARIKDGRQRELMEQMLRTLERIASAPQPSRPPLGKTGQRPRGRRVTKRGGEAVQVTVLGSSLDDSRGTVTPIPPSGST
jgi:hypothetical protein